MTSRRKKYVEHTVCCSGCGDVLIEIFAPVPGEVVIGHRSVELDLKRFRCYGDALISAGIDVADEQVGALNDAVELATGGQPYKPARRRAREWKYTTHVHMVDPVYGAFYAPSSVSSTCRCTYSRNFDVNELLAREGKSSTEAPYRHDWRDQ